MELRHLRYFVAVAETESLSLAAKVKLHTSQPSLSRQIRDLEEEIGARLLTRGARGIELTPAGRVFLDHAQTRSLAGLESGRIVYTLLLHDDARVFIDATLWKHADDRWWMFTGRRSDIDTIQVRARSFDVRVRERSDVFAVLALESEPVDPRL